MSLVQHDGHRHATISYGRAATVPVPKHPQLAGAVAERISEKQNGGHEDRRLPVRFVGSITTAMA